MKNIESICFWIEENKTRIIKNIDRESIDVYNFLNEQYTNSDVRRNYIFQFVYRSFYRLDNAGLTPEFKNEYFNILEELKNTLDLSFDRVLKRLYRFQNKKGQYSVQFSFVTKMFNTFNNSMPIYDSEIAKIFSLKYPNFRQFDIKLEKYLCYFYQIVESYNTILQKNLLSATFKGFDYNFQENCLSEIKKLDFIFWSAGKLYNDK